MFRLRDRFFGFFVVLMLFGFAVSFAFGFLTVFIAGIGVFI